MNFSDILIDFIKTDNDFVSVVNKDYLYLDKNDFIHTIKQNEEKINEVINEQEFNIGFQEQSRSDLNMITIYVEPIDKDYYFEIFFYYKENNGNYCLCKNTDKDYNNYYQCCGNTCSWEIPTIEINKIESACQLNFKGSQKELWFLKKDEEIENIKKEIKRLQDSIAKDTQRMIQIIEELEMIEENKWK